MTATADPVHNVSRACQPEQSACLLEAALIQGSIEGCQLSTLGCACLHPGSCRKGLHSLLEATCTCAMPDHGQSTRKREMAGRDAGIEECRGRAEQAVRRSSCQHQPQPLLCDHVATQSLCHVIMSLSTAHYYPCI